MQLRKIALVAFLALGLAGCSTTTGLLKPEDLYPKILTHCADEPVVPARPSAAEPRTDRAKAAYIKSLHGAYADCHDTVDGWAERRSKYVKQYEGQHYNYFERIYRDLTGAASDD